MKIIGFYHLLLTNHFADIANEQIATLVNSGLYKEADKIVMGCLGSEENLEILKEIIYPYPKIEIGYHSENIYEYEFATLRLMKDVADNESKNIFMFYFHGKAVSFSKEEKEWAYEGGNQWRQHLNYWNLTKWRDNIKKLNSGYDTCGVKYIENKTNSGNPSHYSGNYYFAMSHYIKKLPYIQTLNIADRFQAEFWIGMASPKAATLNQEQVDYNYKGKFKPPEKIVFSKAESTLLSAKDLNNITKNSFTYKSAQSFYTAKTTEIIERELMPECRTAAEGGGFATSVQVEKNNEGYSRVVDKLKELGFKSSFDHNSDRIHISWEEI